MITIKHDEHLAALADEVRISGDEVAQAIIDTIDPYLLDDHFAGMTLKEFIEEKGYYIEDFVDGLHFHGSVLRSRLTPEIGTILLKLKFFYMDADEPCRNCGYELVWLNDDEAVQGFLSSTCSMCHVTSVKEV
jgi:hypothetical protein